MSIHFEIDTRSSSATVFWGQMLLLVKISMPHEPLVEITKQLWGFKAKTF